MREQIADVLSRALSEIEQADRGDLDALKTHYIGRKGEITMLLRSVGSAPAEQRPQLGQLANKAKKDIGQAIEQRARQLQEEDTVDAIDITLPGRKMWIGVRHPVSAVREQIERIFSGMGFSIALGPEIETDEMNFAALNIPIDHPARDMQDTFYITDQLLLRTHTSPVQIRHMLSVAPALPVRIIAPGLVYRRDDDITHTPMFSQVEGLAVDTDISMGDLRGVLQEFARQMFGSTTNIRFRASYFPFTEPSAEVDVSCTVCGGDGCRTCGQSGWLEILGAGMVHPVVLANGGYDPEQVTGFAFGMGIERVAMLTYGIDELRPFFDNDIRFLRQVGGDVW